MLKEFQKHLKEFQPICAYKRYTYERVFRRNLFNKYLKQLNYKIEIKQIK